MLTPVVDNGVTTLADADDPIAFQGAATVTVEAGGTTPHDFGSTPP